MLLLHCAGTEANRESKALQGQGQGQGYGSSGTGTGTGTGGQGYGSSGTGTGGNYGSSGTGTGQGGQGYGVAGMIPGTEANREKKADQGQYGDSKLLQVCQSHTRYCCACMVFFVRLLMHT